MIEKRHEQALVEVHTCAVCGAESRVCATIDGEEFCPLSRISGFVTPRLWRSHPMYGKQLCWLCLTSGKHHVDGIPWLPGSAHRVLVGGGAVMLAGKPPSKKRFDTEAAYAVVREVGHARALVLVLQSGHYLPVLRVNALEYILSTALVDGETRTCLVEPRMTAPWPTAYEMSNPRWESAARVAELFGEQCAERMQQYDEADEALVVALTRIPVAALSR